jgi:RNA polymerase II subunit A C-terminal domain phosphatase
LLEAEADGLCFTNAGARKEAARLEQLRLSSRQLSLVLDLDHTLIEATADARAYFALHANDDDSDSSDSSDGSSGISKNDRKRVVDDLHRLDLGFFRYYVKLRPGLREFLSRCARLFDLFLYTNGERGYAEQIMAILDADKSLFRGRVLTISETRDTNKTLEKLMPYSDYRMVLVVDDRAIDVWGPCKNVCKIVPFRFWRAVGNSLATGQARPQMAAEVAAIARLHDRLHSVAKHDNNDDDDNVLDAPATVPPLQFDDATNTKTIEALLTHELCEAIVWQLLDPASRIALSQTCRHWYWWFRPRWPRMLPSLVGADVAALTARTLHPLSAGNQARHERNWSLAYAMLASCECAAAEPVEKIVRLSMLDDNSLECVYEHLRDAHTRFFAELAPDAATLPDVRTLMAASRASVLANVGIVFSGVFPSGTSVADTELGQVARSYGAAIFDDVLDDGATHVACLASGTAKALAARSASPPRLVVTIHWLIDSIRLFRRCDESRYDASSAPPIAPAQFHASFARLIREHFVNSVVEQENDVEPSAKRQRLSIAAPSTSSDDDDDDLFLDDLESELASNWDQ